MHEAAPGVTIEPLNENCDINNWDITELEEDTNNLDHLEFLASKVTTGSSSPSHKEQELEDLIWLEGKVMDVGKKLSFKN